MWVVEPLLSPEAEDRNYLEAIMQKVSLTVSLLGLGLMVTGFADMLAHGAPLSIPGPSTLSPVLLMPRSQVPVSLVAMSVGIVLLALLPVVRVLLVFWLYVRRQEVLNALAALIVFVELMLSVRTGA